MNLYFGVDLSLTGTGLISINDTGDIVNQKLVVTKPKEFTTDEERLMFIVENVMEFISIVDKSNIKKICIEGISFGSRGQSMYQLAGLHYLLRTNLFLTYPLKYKIIPPTTLKKFVTGKGNCKKDLMLLKVYKRWGIEFDNDNLCDAFSLARMALEGYKNENK